MASRVRGFAVALVLLVGASATAEAQMGPAQFGPRVLYNFDAEEFGIGAHFVKPLTEAFSIYPSVEYLFVTGGTWLNFNADVTYTFANPSLEWLYVGAGLAISRFSVDDCDDVLPGFDCSTTDTGLNLIGGFQPATGGRIKPFAEARLVLGGSESFQVVGGLKIPLGN